MNAAREGLPGGPDTLAGQVAIVTGGGRGLGFAAGEMLARLGASVVLSDLDEDAGADAAARLEGQGLAVSARHADASDEQMVDTLVSGVIADHGRIDILVNLAGIYPRGSIEEMTLDFWHRVISASLDSTFLCCRAVLPHMRAAGYGRIVNTSSGTIYLGPTDQSAYVAAKMGVIGFTRCLAKAYGEHGITANVIMPGAIETEGTSGNYGGGEARRQATERLIGIQSIKRRGMPADIAAPIAYMVSPAASFMTGEVINVDGGISFTG